MNDVIIYQGRFMIFSGKEWSRILVASWVSFWLGLISLLVIFP